MVQKSDQKVASRSYLEALTDGPTSGQKVASRSYLEALTDGPKE